LRGEDLNLRSPGYEPDDLTTGPPRDSKLIELSDLGIARKSAILEGRLKNLLSGPGVRRFDDRVLGTPVSREEVGDLKFSRSPVSDRKRNRRDRKE
jgi:hypothetical protein